MIDAFKPEYLRYAPYLNSLTKEKQWGELEMPSGHGGGMEIFFRGKSDKLATFYKKQNSSLNWIKYFIWAERLGDSGRYCIDCIINILRFISGKELHRTGKIPLKQLCEMEMVDSKEFCKNLEIDYVYIKDLDGAGHKYGTKSDKIIRIIKKIDEKISKMNFDIILSDHGMIDIKKTISVPITKDCIIDSDMARYWGKKPDFNSEDGKWIEWGNKEYGDFIFLANPGVLIFPNFWDSKEPSKAMHGYDGKHKDMKGIYILNKAGREKNLKVEHLHNILIRMIKVAE